MHKQPNCPECAWPWGCTWALATVTGPPVPGAAVTAAASGRPAMLAQGNQHILQRLKETCISVCFSRRDRPRRLVRCFSVQSESPSSLAEWSSAMRTAQAQAERREVDSFATGRTGPSSVLSNPDNLLRQIGDSQRCCNGHSCIPSRRLLGFPSAISSPHRPSRCSVAPNNHSSNQPSARMLNRPNPWCNPFGPCGSKDGVASPRWVLATGTVPPAPARRW